MGLLIAIIIIITIIAAVAIIVYGVYAVIKNKERENGKRRKKADSSGGGGNVKNSKVKDSRDLVKEIEEIRDGIIITEDCTRFISVITCRGVNDFYDQSAAEQMSVMKGYLGFINTLTGPMTYRMYTKELDMDYTIKKYSDKRDEFIQKYRFLEASLVGIPKEAEADRKRLEEEMESVRFRINHLTSEMEAVNFYSSSAVAMEQMQDYVFDWKYRAADFDTDLTEEERFMRAKAELDVLASAKIAALSTAGIKARVCTEGELIDICRRISQPISVERFRMKELAGSSYFDDIMTSESMENMGYVVAEEAASKGIDMFNDMFSTTAKAVSKDLMNDQLAREKEQAEKEARKKEEKAKDAVKEEEDSADEEEVFVFGEEE